MIKKSRKKIFKKSLPRKRARRVHFNIKRNKPNILKRKSNADTESKEKTPPKKISFIQQQDQYLEEKDEVQTFEELDIIENDLNESQELNFPNASFININDPNESQDRII